MAKYTLFKSDEHYIMEDKIIYTEGGTVKERITEFGNLRDAFAFMRKYDIKSQCNFGKSNMFCKLELFGDGNKLVADRSCILDTRSNKNEVFCSEKIIRHR